MHKWFWKKIGNKVVAGIFTIIVGIIWVGTMVYYPFHIDKPQRKYGKKK